MNTLNFLHYLYFFSRWLPKHIIMGDEITKLILILS